MDVTLLRCSFEQIIEREPDLAGRFYQILFQRHPQTRALFRGDTRAQGKMLAGALQAVIDHLEDAAWLVPTLEGLGARHAGYGITDEMYEWVGECLLAALAEVAGEDWSASHILAWSEAYGFIADTMKAGARRALAAA